MTILADDLTGACDTGCLFAGAGAVGVWTKADSVTLFDDFAYGAAK